MKESDKYKKIVEKNTPLKFNYIKEIHYGGTSKTQEKMINHWINDQPKFLHEFWIKEFNDSRSPKRGTRASWFIDTKQFDPRIVERKLDLIELNAETKRQTGQEYLIQNLNSETILQEAKQINNSLIKQQKSNTTKTIIIVVEIVIILILTYLLIKK